MPDLQSIPLLAGAAAGFIHVLSGPDHLAALAPLAVKHSFKAWIVGLRWGLGHASGVLAIAALAWITRGLLPIDATSQWAERLVGIMLIAIGIWAFRGTLKIQIHLHPHTHDGSTHAHLHLHTAPHNHETTPPTLAQPPFAPTQTPHPITTPKSFTPLPNTPPHKHTHTAFWIGTLHGLAGSAHFLGVLPALAMSKSAATAYLLAFALGTIAAMITLTTSLGYLATRFKKSAQPAYKALMLTCSLTAISVGSFWLLT